MALIWRQISCEPDVPAFLNRERSKAKSVSAFTGARMASSDIRSVINVFGLPMNIINIARRIHAYFGTIDWSIDIYVGTTYLRKRTTLRYFDLHTTPKF